MRLCFAKLLALLVGEPDSFAAGASRLGHGNWPCQQSLRSCGSIAIAGLEAVASPVMALDPQPTACRQVQTQKPASQDTEGREKSLARLRATFCERMQRFVFLYTFRAFPCRPSGRFRVRARLPNLPTKSYEEPKSCSSLF